MFGKQSEFVWRRVDYSVELFSLMKLKFKEIYSLVLNIENISYLKYTLPIMQFMEYAAL